MDGWMYILVNHVLYPRLKLVLFQRLKMQKSLSVATFLVVFYRFIHFQAERLEVIFEKAGTE